MSNLEWCVRYFGTLIVGSLLGAVVVMYILVRF